MQYVVKMLYICRLALVTTADTNLSFVCLLGLWSSMGLRESLFQGFIIKHRFNQPAQLQRLASILKEHVASKAVRLSRRQTSKVQIRLCGSPISFAYGIYKGS